MPGAALIGGLASIAGSGISQMIAGNQADEASPPIRAAPGIRLKH